ncbi:MAG: xanthine dehydrogenase molybdopterin binding subunit [Candidatus Kariarchaeaceae archaeon]|jgi:xanthine dehydrogenase large subunit
MKNIDSHTHVRGESVYVDDILPQVETLYAAVFYSPVASGIIKSIDYQKAKKEGARYFLTVNDIPGENQIGRIIPDEELLADQEVDFIGQPIAVILAGTEEEAKRALSKIEIEIEEKTPIIDPREAFEKNKLISPSSYSILGDVDTTWDKCEHIVEGNVEIGGQEHLYIETQGAYAFPIENGGIKVISSTQGPTAVQSTIARVLNIPMHKVEVDVRRLGGGFGGKEDQATAWACLAALGVHISNKPVKLILDRIDDMVVTGKRHPYSTDYKLGLDQEGKILAYQVTFYQNSGAAADLSPPVLGRTMFHATNAYYIPNVKVKGIMCKTNITPNTAFRGFGGPQGMVVIEAALDHAAEKMGLEKWQLQKKNLVRDGDSFHYGQIAERTNSILTWETAEEKYNLSQLINEVKEFNKINPHTKKGFAVMPVCFGISFTKTSLNQAGALVHIYFDGSIGVSTGAVEMGQGVNTRILQVPARIFSLPQSKIKIDTTNTARVINTSPSAASATHDLNGKATEVACLKLLKRLKETAVRYLDRSDVSKVEIIKGKIVYDGSKTKLSWTELVSLAYQDRVDLSEHGFYATPEIYFDMKTQKGHPFAYHVYGTAFFEVTLDCIRGTYEFDSVKVVHDSGKSMNPIIDLGQVEGSIVQGMGWMTSEELLWDDQGRLLSNTLSTYKVPDIFAAPKEILTHFLENTENPLGLFKSKAVGEPPFMYSIGAYFAIRNAIKAFNPNSTIGYDTPLTPEKALLALYDM